MSLYKENKLLFYMSLFSIICIMVGLYYGYNVTNMLSIQKENDLLRHRNDSLINIINLK
jgi:uncharacterized membrane protein